MNASAATTYDFSVFPASIPVTRNSANSAFFQIGPGGGPNQRAQLTVRATNACGSTSALYDFYVRTPGYYAVAPNPANTEALVEAKSGTDNGTATLAGVPTLPLPPYTARLYNSYGLLVHTQTSEAGQVRLNTAHLPNGLYTLRLSEGADVKTSRLQIQH